MILVADASALIATRSERSARWAYCFKPNALASSPALLHS